MKKNIYPEKVEINPLYENYCNGCNFLRWIGAAKGRRHCCRLQLEPMVKDGDNHIRPDACKALEKGVPT